MWGTFSSVFECGSGKSFRRLIRIGLCVNSSFQYCWVHLELMISENLRAHLKYIVCINFFVCIIWHYNRVTFVKFQFVLIVVLILRTAMLTKSPDSVFSVVSPASSASPASSSFGYEDLSLCYKDRACCPICELLLKVVCY